MHFGTPTKKWKEANFCGAVVASIHGVAVEDDGIHVLECFIPRVKTPSFRGGFSGPIAEVGGPREVVIGEVLGAKDLEVTLAIL